MNDEILENLQNEAEASEVKNEGEDTAPAEAEAPAPKEKKEHKAKSKEILIACVKFRYIHSEKMRFKDIFGQSYDLEKGSVIIVPKGSLEQHCSTKKTLFKRV